MELGLCFSQLCRDPSCFIADAPSALWTLTDPSVGSGSKCGVTETLHTHTYVYQAHSGNTLLRRLSPSQPYLLCLLGSWGLFQWVQQRGISPENPKKLSTLRLCLVFSQKVNPVLVLKTNHTKSLFSFFRQGLLWPRVAWSFWCS